jgi:hypothetical protein
MKTTIAGRISVKNRKALVAPVAEFAEANKLPINLVMSSVLWAGETMAARMCAKSLKALITSQTVDNYSAELARRAQARESQVRGMVKHSLPKEQRIPEVIDQLSGQVLGILAGMRNASITDIKLVISSLRSAAPVA